MSKRPQAPPADLEVGVLVEATPEGQKGCWYLAEIVELGAPDAKGQSDALLAYPAEYLVDGADAPLQEWQRTRELRPCPPEDPPDEFPAALDRGDRVELLRDGGYYESAIISIHPDPTGGPTQYVVRPTHYASEKYRVTADALRPPWTWRNGEWIVAYNSKTRKVVHAGAPTGAHRRPDAPTLAPGAARRARAEADDGTDAKPDTAAAAAVTTGGARARGKLDDDGYGPPEARPSSFAEGTSRQGVDGQQWVVVSAEGGASIWSLPGKSFFFLDRAKRQQLQRRELKKRETKAAASAAAKVQQSVARAAAAKTAAGRSGGGGTAAAGTTPAPARELANVQCALDLPVQLAPRKGGRGHKERANAEHARVLGVLERLIRHRGEGVLARISDVAIERSEASPTGLVGVTVHDGPGGYFDVTYNGRSVGARAAPCRDHRAPRSPSTVPRHAERTPVCPKARIPPALTAPRRPSRTRRPLRFERQGWPVARALHSHPGRHGCGRRRADRAVQRGGGRLADARRADPRQAGAAGPPASTGAPRRRDHWRL